jgi:parallel beta-helix repeat protein
MRRRGRWLPLALLGLVSLGCAGQTTRVSVADVQALASGEQDATQAIQAAIDALGEAGGTVRLPAGTYAHSGVIHVRSHVTLEGAGDQTVLVATNPAQASVSATGAVDVAIKHLKLTSRATERLSALYNHQLTLTRTRGAVVEGVSIDGSAAAGIFVHVSHQVRVSGCTVANTLADGIHVTGGSQDVRVSDNTLTDTGDDAIAVVSYRGDGAICQDVSVHDNRVTRSRSRGLAVVGGSRVSFRHNVVSGTRYAGLYAASEPFYDTMACSDIRFSDNRLQDVNRLPSPDLPYQGILLSGRAGFPVERVLIEKNHLSGAGFRGLEANAHVASALIRDNHFTDVADIGMALGGRDMVVTGNVVSGAGSYGIAVTTTARGASVVAGNTIERPNRQGSGHVDALNADASSLDLLVLAGNALRLDGAVVERGLEVTPGSGRLVLGPQAGEWGARLVLGRADGRWDARVQTVPAWPTSSAWNRNDTLLLDEAARRFSVWICTTPGLAGSSGGAAFEERFSLRYPAEPAGMSE